MRLPIFHQNQGAVARANAEAERLRRQYHDRWGLAALEVKQAFLRLVQAEQDLLIWREQVVPQAQATLDTAQKALPEDAVSLLLVLESTRQLLAAEQREIDGRAQLRRSVAELERSLGRRLFSYNRTSPAAAEIIPLPDPAAHAPPAGDAAHVSGGGFIDTPNQRLPVRHVAAIVTADDLARTVVSFRDGTPLRLGDVAEVREGHAPPIGDAIINDVYGLLLIVEKQPSGNTLDVTRTREQAARVHDAVADVEGVSDLKIEQLVLVPQTDVRLKPAAAEQFGLTPGDVRRAATTLIKGRIVGEVYRQQKVFQVALWPWRELSCCSIRNFAPGGSSCS